MKQRNLVEKSNALYVSCRDLVILLTLLIFHYGCGERKESSDFAEMLNEEIPQCSAATVRYFSLIHTGAELDISRPIGVNVQTVLVPGIHDVPPSSFEDATVVAFDDEGVHTLFIATDADECAMIITRSVVEVVSSFPVDVGIEADSARFMGWSTGWSMPVIYGDSTDEMWRRPERAMGPASGSATDVVSLGAGGQIELHFDGMIYDGDGADFAIFENSFSPTFLELALVSVSSDGVHFVSFPTIYLGQEEVGAFGDHDAEMMYGFAGRFPAGIGTPFDLKDLAFEPDVIEGLVDINQIVSVRLTDIVGDGNTVDSLGNPIFDPFPTMGSAGFDLDAVGVIHLR